MDFRTRINIQESEYKISYNSNLLTMGSCFAENMGNMLTKYKFNTNLNPFGVVYNPISVGNSLKFLINKTQFTEEDLSFADELWFSFYHHSRFSNPNIKQCLNKINTEIQTASASLESADVLIITFGTAWVYELKETGTIVSNCHKQPTKDFNRYRLEVDEIVQYYKELLITLSLFNPRLKLVFTVSPIRHWKDGAHQNQLSKATLLLAIDQLVQLFEHVSYFPSYEMLIDELRDYRFYSEDMIHINTTSIKYIWARFVETYMEANTTKLMKKVEKIIAAANHRPFNPDSDKHQQFIFKLLSDMEALENQYPSIAFDLERSLMRKNLHL